MNSWGWPGNVRELENRMKRAVIMADGKLITAADLDLDGDEEAELMLNLKAARELADRKALRLALARPEGNISNAATLLGISRPTFYDLLQTYNIQPWPNPSPKRLVRLAAFFVGEGFHNMARGLAHASAAHRAGTDSIRESGPERLCRSHVGLNPVCFDMGQRARRKRTTARRFMWCGV